MENPITDAHRLQLVQRLLEKEFGRAVPINGEVLLQIAKRILPAHSPGDMRANWQRFTRTVRLFMAITRPRWQPK